MKIARAALFEWIRMVYKYTNKTKKYGECEQERALNLETNKWSDQQCACSFWHIAIANNNLCALHLFICLFLMCLFCCVVLCWSELWSDFSHLFTSSSSSFFSLYVEICFQCAWLCWFFFSIVRTCASQFMSRVLWLNVIFCSKLNNLYI